MQNTEEPKAPPTPAKAKPQQAVRKEPQVLNPPKAPPIQIGALGGGELPMGTDHVPHLPSDDPERARSPAPRTPPGRTESFKDIATSPAPRLSRRERDPRAAAEAVSRNTAMEIDPAECRRHVADQYWRIARSTEYNFRRQVHLLAVTRSPAFLRTQLSLRWRRI